MIGLGSNRMSVCRRGGMSVTQAGKGGMEWLAGTGSRSPYSAQAAAALKAQFPTQWPTIRDYGVAHPEIVPYVNQDYWLVCSFGIEGMPIRWLVNNNSGKMYTGITPQSNTGVRLLVRNTRNEHNGNVFSAGVTDDRYAMYEQSRNLIYWYYPSSYASTGVGFATPRKVEYNINGKLTVKDLQGTQLFQTNLSQRNCSDELMIGWKYISSPNGYNDYGLFEVVNGNGETIGKFTAYNDNGTIKCIDIYNARLVTIEGTFGMSYTEADGVTPWSPS